MKVCGKCGCRLSNQGVCLHCEELSPVDSDEAVDKMINFHRKRLAWAIVGTLLFVIAYIVLKFLPLISILNRQSSAVKKLTPKTSTKKALPVEGTLLLSSDGIETTLP